MRRAAYSTQLPECFVLRIIDTSVTKSSNVQRSNTVDGVVSSGSESDEKEVTSILLESNDPKPILPLRIPKFFLPNATETFSPGVQFDFPTLLESGANTPDEAIFVKLPHVAIARGEDDCRTWWRTFGINN